MANTYLEANDIFYQAFEPKLSNRFILYMNGIPSYMIKKVNGIGFQQDEVIINHINSYFKVKGGKMKWEDLQLELYDPITPSGSQAIMEWARMHHETITGRAGYSDMYKRNFNIVILGPVGDVVGEWLVKGAFIKNAKFGDYDWTSDNAAINLSRYSA